LKPSDERSPMGKVEVSNEELRTVRDAMRELNRMVDALENGDAEKFVLCQNNRMRAVVISLETFAELRDALAQAEFRAAA
jgi:PHD/YefM family antitoxin component YafN of YafNO toxin-antitoxin module